MSEHLLHLHIPKTAGTSVRSLLVDAYGAKNVLYYDDKTDKAIRSSRRPTASERGAVNRVKETVYRYGLFRPVLPLFKLAKGLEKQLGYSPDSVKNIGFTAMSGHFTGEQLQQWGLGQEKVVSILRNPLDRAWSQFKHWQRTEGLAFPIEGLDFAADTRFEDYALAPQLANYQTRRIGGTTLAHLGVQEVLPEFLEEIGLPVPSGIPRANSGMYTDSPPQSIAFMNEFEAANAVDYELFEKTLQTYQTNAGH